MMPQWMRRLRSPYTLIAILGLLLVVQIVQNRTLLGASAAPQPAAEGRPPPIIIDKPLQTTTLRDLEGAPVDLAALGTERQLAILFSTTCQYCKADAALWEAIQAANPELAVYAVTTETDVAAVSAYASEMGLTIPVYLDPEGLFTKELDLLVTPTKVLLSADLRPLFIWYGQTTHQGGNQDIGAMLGFLNVQPEAIPEDFQPQD